MARVAWSRRSSSSRCLENASPRCRFPGNAWRSRQEKAGRPPPIDCFTSVCRRLRSEGVSSRSRKRSLTRHSFGPTVLNLFHFNPLEESTRPQVLTEVAALISKRIAVRDAGDGLAGPVPAARRTASEALLRIHAGPGCARALLHSQLASVNARDRSAIPCAMQHRALAHRRCDGARLISTVMNTG